VLWHPKGDSRLLSVFATQLARVHGGHSWKRQRAFKNKPGDDDDDDDDDRQTDTLTDRHTTTALFTALA